MPDVRLIDADALCRKISESIRQANEWENEAREKKDTHGVKCAIDTKRSLLSMLSRVQEEPTIDAQPVKRGKWSEYSRNALETYIECTNCCVASRPIHLQMVTGNGSRLPDYCPNCGAKMSEVNRNVE